MSVSADSQETRRKTWWFLKVREVNYVSAAKAPNRKVSDNWIPSSLLSLSLEVSAFGLFVTFFRKVGDEHRVVKHPLRSRVKGQNVCLARRVAGVRFGLFECRLSGCSRCR